MVRLWTKDFTPRMLQELAEAEYYVSKFGRDNTYASHMILISDMAKKLDEKENFVSQGIKSDETT